MVKYFIGNNAGGKLQRKSTASNDNK